MELIKIRILQLKREARALGILYSLAIILIFLFFVYKAHVLYSKPDISLYFSGLICAVVYYIQLVRPDKSFIFAQVEKPHAKIFAEYVFFLLPFLAAGLISPYWCVVFPEIFLIFVISRVRYGFRRKTKLSLLGNIISSKNFEWLAGIRKHRIYFGLVYAAALLSSPVVIIPLLCLVLLTMTVTGFYKYCEPLNVLRECGCSPHGLLAGKIFRHTGLLAVFFIPVLVINSIFNPPFLIINIALLLVQPAILSLAIVFKYKIYSPGDTLTGNEIYIALIQVLTVLPFVMGGIPFLLPLPFFLSLKYFFSASDNLKQYMYD